MKIATTFTREQATKKRIKELTASRDEWKEKSSSYKKRADSLESD